MNATHSILVKIIFSVVVTLFCQAAIHAQNLGDQLRNKLQGKTKLSEVMAIVDETYSKLTEEQRQKGYDGLMKIKHWKRWEWYMSRHLGAEGEFVNISEHYYDLINSRGIDGMPSTRSTIQGSWESLGPEACSIMPTPEYIGEGIGRVDRIAFDPDSANIFYVGTPNGGLWKTYNGGESWEPLLDDFPSLGISGITISPTNPNDIFILTGVGDSHVGSYYESSGMANSLGVFRSLNGGESWAYTSDFPVPNGNTYITFDLAQSQVSETVLYAATNEGIFRTFNSGASWTLVKTGHFYDVEFMPGSASIAYAATGNTIYRTFDFGQTWTACTLNVPPALSPDRIALAVTPANPFIVYAFFGNDPGVADTFSGIYASEDIGWTFTQRAIHPNILGNTVSGDDTRSQATYDLCIAVHPDSANRVVVGGLNVWHSTNSGNTFSYLKGWHSAADSLYVHVDQHAVAFNPLNNKLYMCNDGGVWVSDDNGTTVTNITLGLVLSQFYHLTQDYSESFRVAGGTQDNGLMFRKNGSTQFIKPRGGDGFDAAYMAGNPGKFFASAGTGLARIDCINNTVVSIEPDGMFFKEIVTHPIDSNIVYCAGINKIFKSSNQGNTWTNVGGKGSWAMAISPSNPDYMYAAGSNSWFFGTGEAYNSVDEGDTWQLMTNAPGFPSLQNHLLTGIAVHPSNHLHVTVTIAGYSSGMKVFHSWNGGNNWLNISYNLPNVPVLSIVTTPDGIFIGTGITVYFIVHGTFQWIDVGSNLPHAGITDLNYNHNSGVLIASTFGRGVWQRNVCVDDITLTYPLTGELSYKCDDQLTSSSYIPGDSIDRINFLANGSIKMTPGFNVKSGAYLKAKIELCDDGNIPYQGIDPEIKASLSNRQNLEKGN